VRNIEIFESYSALILAMLYERFPLKYDIDCVELIALIEDELWDEVLPHQTVGDGEIKVREHHKSPVAIAKPTLEWLQYAGLIDFSSIDSNNFKGVWLTPKGLESIKSKPKNEKRLIRAASDIFKDVAKDTAKKELKKAFSEIITWCSQHPSIVQVFTNTGG
jgi:hypothetical protein